MELTDFQWQEREGRYEDDAPFHEWIYLHASGRIFAAIQGLQQVTMVGGPYLFLNFDAAKHFVEAAMAERAQSVSPEGSVTMIAATAQLDGPMQTDGRYRQIFVDCNAMDCNAIEVPDAQ
jgi:hypothetical protein